MAFAFTTSSTLPLYASLKGSIQPISTTKKGKIRSFRTLSLLSLGVATALFLPLVLFSASPSLDRPVSLNQCLTRARDDLHPILQETFTLPPNPLVSVLSTFTLLLRIPSLLITTPHVPTPIFIQRSTTAAFQEGFSSGVVWVVMLLLGLITSITGAGDHVGNLISILGLVGALAGTYLLPGTYLFSTSFINVHSRAL